MSILNAYYLPPDGQSHLYDEISPINTFPIVLNLIFSTNYEILEDASYFLTPRHIVAQPPECRVLCGSACARMPSPITLVVSLTGFAARIGIEQKKGAELAVEEINRSGGRLSLLIADSQSLPDRAYSAALRSISQDNTKVVVGQLGSQLMSSLSSRYPDVIFINLGRETTLDSPSQNAFLLPLGIFERLEPVRSKKQIAGCPTSIYAWQAYTAIQLLEAAVSLADSGDLRDIMQIVNDKHLRTSAGIFSIHSGVFILQ